MQKSVAVNDSTRGVLSQTTKPCVIMCLLSFLAIPSCSTAEESTTEGSSNHVMISEGQKAAGRFHEVVRIRSRWQGSRDVLDCTATAISNNALITTAHCVHNKRQAAHSVCVTTATGGNRSSRGAYATRVQIGDQYPGNLGHDMAIVMFKHNTFKAISKRGSPWGKLWRSEATIVGYGP